MMQVTTISLSPSTPGDAGKTSAQAGDSGDTPFANVLTGALGSNELVPEKARNSAVSAASVATGKALLGTAASVDAEQSLLPVDGPVDSEAAELNREHPARAELRAFAAQIERADFRAVRLAATGKGLPVSADELPVPGKELPVAAQALAIAEQSGVESTLVVDAIAEAITAPGSTIAPGSQAVTGLGSQVLAAPSSDEETAPGSQIQPEAVQVVPLVADIGAPFIAGQAVDDAQGAATSEEQALPLAKPRALSPTPADLETRRAAAPTATTWEFAEKLGLKVPNGSVAKASAPENAALGEIALDTSAQKNMPRAAVRKEFELSANPSTANTSARLATLAGAAASAAGSDASSRSAEGVQMPIIDGSIAGRTNGSAMPGASTDTRGAQHFDMAGLVDRLVEGRVQARADRNHVELPHPDFGRVTLALSLQADNRLSIDLPGAPNELRQAVGHAFGQSARGENNSTASGSGSGPQGDNGAGTDRNQGEARDGAKNQQARRGEDASQTRSGRQSTNTQTSTPDTLAESRRGVLA